MTCGAQEFRTPFAAALTTALKNFDPPYLGVVGPTCADGNKKILTHDFVHRTHRQIFQTYYPVVLTDWWMDDWISKVYPRGSYGRHASVAVSHHTWMTGSGNPVRYEVDHAHKQFLDAELRRGAQLIGQFAMNHCRKGTCHQPDGHVTPEWKGVYDAANQTVFESVMRDDDEDGDSSPYSYGRDSSLGPRSHSSSSSSSSSHPPADAFIPFGNQQGGGGVGEGDTGEDGDEGVGGDIDDPEDARSGSVDPAQEEENRFDDDDDQVDDTLSGPVGRDDDEDDGAKDGLAADRDEMGGDGAISGEHDEKDSDAVGSAADKAVDDKGGRGSGGREAGGDGKAEGGG